MRSAPEEVQQAADNSQPAATTVSQVVAAASPTSVAPPTGPQQEDLSASGGWLGQVGSHLVSFVMPPSTDQQAPAASITATEASPSQPEGAAASPVAPPTEPPVPVDAPSTETQLVRPPQSAPEEIWRDCSWNYASDWGSHSWSNRDDYSDDWGSRRRNPWAGLH